jgi:hypothetical protein
MPISRKHLFESLTVLNQLPGGVRLMPRLNLHMSMRLSMLMASLTLFCLAFLSPVSVHAQVDYWVPWVTDLTTNSATINWHGSDAVSGSVEYATSAYYEEHHGFQHTITSTATGAYQHVALTDLDPNTSYAYRARPSDNQDQFSTRTFKTMPVSGPFTFIVISDTHAQEKRFKAVADAIAKNETDILFILAGGDYTSFDHEPYWSVFFQYADGMLAKFPIFHAIGNHEYHNHGNSGGPPTAADQYHWTYNVPKGGALNYSFDCSNVRFVILNSPDPNNANGDDPQPSLALAKSQAAWLKERLKTKMAGKFTIHHHPIWNYGKTGIDARLQPWETLYHQYPISANFAGHVHSYQRYSVSGIPYFIIANAGGKFVNLNPSDPTAKWYQYGETRQLGYLKVAVDPANNRATAQEIFVAYVESNDSEDPIVYDSPIIADTLTFPLSSVSATETLLTVSKSGLGAGTVHSSDSHIHCGDTCQATYKKTERVSFTATADAGSVFMGWTGACNNLPKCSIKINPSIGITNVGAIFEKNLCVYSLSPKSKTFTYKGGKASVRLTAKGYGITNCPAPTIRNETDWITYVSGPFANNKGTVVVTVPANSTTTSRQGVLDVGGRDFTANQNGKP